MQHLACRAHRALALMPWLAPLIPATAAPPRHAQGQGPATWEPLGWHAGCRGGCR